MKLRRSGGIVKWLLLGALLGASLANAAKNYCMRCNGDGGCVIVEC